MLLKYLCTFFKICHNEGINTMNLKQRSSGVLLHISSLPSPYGIGTLGKEAYQFVDFLKDCHVKIWQMLPLNVTSYGDSPYQSPSSNGLNYYFIDLRVLVEKGLLTQEEVEACDMGDNPQRVNYGKLFNNRIPLLKLAFSRFDKKEKAFVDFVNKGKYHDFAFFMTLKSLNGFAPWYQWEDKYRNYTPLLEIEMRQKHSDLYLFYQWTQYEFLLEFNQLKQYVHDNGIVLLGDMPLYLAFDSVEAYKYPQLFLFDEKHNPTVVAGVPPDYFSVDGQLWGNPIYDWDYMKKTGYQWFNERIEKNLKVFDLLRIDHFRGFSSYFTIPFGMTNARIGQWVKGPGMDFFKDKTDLPIIAEDLGDLDEDVYTLLRESTYPGMKVLEFAFDGDKDNPHKPTNSTENFCCYTGTHDNMPLRGYLEQLDEQALSSYRNDLKEQCKLYDVDYRGDDVVSLCLTTCSMAYASPCRFAVLPLQDLLALGANTRMNLPSSLSEDNWSYRAKKEDFSEDLKQFIQSNIERYHR